MMEKTMETTMMGLLNRDLNLNPEPQALKPQPSASILLQGAKTSNQTTGFGTPDASGVCEQSALKL